MSKRTRFKSCIGCGFDGDDLLLTVVSRRRQGQQKDSWEDHKYQIVKAMALIAC